MGLDILADRPHVLSRRRPARHLRRRHHLRHRDLPALAGHQHQLALGPGGAGLRRLHAHAGLAREPPARRSADAGQEVIPMAALARKSSFGKLPDGRAVDLYTLTNHNGLVAKVTNYGTIITELQ